MNFVSLRASYLLGTREELLPSTPLYTNKDFIVWSGTFVPPLREFKAREKLVVIGVFEIGELDEF